MRPGSNIRNMTDMTAPCRATTRRRFALGAGLAVTAGPALLAAWAARAEGATPKTDVGYQYSPKGAQSCGLCASFIPGPDASGPGTCQIVAGPIPQAGWCQLWAKK
jgi:hypothetical protein